MRALAERRGARPGPLLGLQRLGQRHPAAVDGGQPVAINPDGRLRDHARRHGWRVRDYRTGRKAAKIGVPTAAGLGAPGRCGRAAALVGPPPAA